MNGGIDQLVDTYKGNPQPLAQKVQKAQQGQPPGEVPPDLEEAIALQKITELRNSAQGQQAMQAGGAQQSVVEKLRQMLGGMQQQAQMQGQPVMAASGGDITQLMSNLGQNYAGGGIVAFNGEDDSKVEDTDVKKKLQQYTLQQQGADWVARKQAARLAEAENEARRQALMSQIPTGGQQAPASTGPMPGELERNVGNTLAAIPGASVSKAFSGSGLRSLLGLLGIAGDREDKPTAREPAKPSPTDTNFRRQPDPRMTGTPAVAPDVPLITSAPAAPRPTAGGPTAGGPVAPAKPVVEAMDPMETALRKSIMDALAQDPEAIRKKAMEQNAQFMGLDALLKPAQDRAAAREARIKEIQGSRQPLWIDALLSAGKPTRGGIAGVLGNMAAGTSVAKQNYDAEDLKFLDELNKLNSEIDRAKIDGRYKDVAAGQAAVKDLISEKRQAEQSGTSLLNTKENARSREQAANIAAQARLDAARARGTGVGAGDKQQLSELKALQTSLKDQLKEPRMMGKAGDDLRRQLATVNAEIAKMAGLSTMAAAPGAASPGGTSLKYNPKTGKIE